MKNAYDNEFVVVDRDLQQLELLMAQMRKTLLLISVVFLLVLFFALKKKTDAV